MVLQGYNDIRELDSVNVMDIAPAVANTTVRQAITRAIGLQTRLGNAKRSRRVKVTLEQTEVAAGVKPITGEQVVLNIAKNVGPGALDAVDSKLAEHGVQRMKERPKPRSLITDLNKVAATHGQSKVDELLSDRVAAVRGYNWKGSWRSIQSRLRFGLLLQLVSWATTCPVHYHQLVRSMCKSTWLLCSPTHALQTIMSTTCALVVQRSATTRWRGTTMVCRWL